MPFEVLDFAFVLARLFQAGKRAQVAPLRVEHYEIAAYGTMRSLANLMGQREISKLLQQTLDEEGSADKKLTHIAGSVNRTAQRQAA